MAFNNTAELKPLINFWHSNNIIKLTSPLVASDKSNPSSIPQGYVEICTLGRVGSNRCGGDTV